ncbi:hypothetical protein [Alloactinosynnema sp. L-07]|nr:hypothetical protein [Alloactinosynnema sp. L-07]
MGTRFCIWDHARTEDPQRWQSGRGGASDGAGNRRAPQTVS